MILVSTQLKRWLKESTIQSGKFWSKITLRMLGSTWNASLSSLWWGTLNWLWMKTQSSTLYASIFKLSNLNCQLVYSFVQALYSCTQTPPSVCRSNERYSIGWSATLEVTALIAAQSPNTSSLSWARKSPHSLAQLYSHWCIISQTPKMFKEWRKSTKSHLTLSCTSAWSSKVPLKFWLMTFAQKVSMLAPTWLKSWISWLLMWWRGTDTKMRSQSRGRTGGRMTSWKERSSRISTWLSKRNLATTNARSCRGRPWSTTLRRTNAWSDVAEMRSCFVQLWSIKSPILLV